MDEMKKLMALQKKAQVVQDQLANTHVEADEGEYAITVNGKQECIEAKKDGVSQPNLVIALNKALKKSQEIAAHEMKDVMGDMGIPGLSK